MEWVPSVSDESSATARRRIILKVADHHLVISLFAPTYYLGGIRIGGIGAAVVKNGGDFQGTSRRNEFWLRVNVLPVAS